jgi:hypothetical protein
LPAVLRKPSTLSLTRWLAVFKLLLALLLGLMDLFKVKGENKKAMDKEVDDAVDSGDVSRINNVIQRLRR